MSSSYYSAQGTLETFQEEVAWAQKQMLLSHDDTVIQGNTLVQGENTIEFGVNYANKDIQAGRIGYNYLGDNALDITGAGKQLGDLNVNIWDNLNVTKTITTPSISSQAKDLIINTNSRFFKDGGLALDSVNGSLEAETITSRGNASVHGALKVKKNADIDGDLAVVGQICFNNKTNCLTAQKIKGDKGDKGDTGMKGDTGPAGPSTIKDHNVLEFGSGIKGKNVDAGKLGYQYMPSSSGLDIVGAGLIENKRMVNIWDRVSIGKTDDAFITIGNRFTICPKKQYEDDDWLRINDPSRENEFGKNVNNFFGGLAAGKLWSKDGHVQGSDERMKKDIKNISQEDVNKLTNLLPVEYSMKDDESNRKRFGFIAQQVDKVYPNLVAEGANGMKSLNYEGFIPILTKKINSIQPNPNTLCIGNVCLSSDELSKLKCMLKNL